MRRGRTTSTPTPVTYVRNVVREPRSGPENNRRRSLVPQREEVPAPASAPVPIPARRSSNTAATHQLSPTAHAASSRYPTSHNGSVPNLLAMTSTPRITQISSPRPLGSNRPSTTAPSSAPTRLPPAVSVRPRSALSRIGSLAYVPAPTPAPVLRRTEGRRIPPRSATSPPPAPSPPPPQVSRPSLAITCPLCLDSADTLTTTLCGHVFCREVCSFILIVPCVCSDIHYPPVHYRRPKRQARMPGLQVLRPDTQPPPSLPEHHSILNVLDWTFPSKEPLTMQNPPLSLAVPKRIKRTKSSIVNLIVPIQLGTVMTITTHKITTGYDFARLFSPPPGSSLAFTIPTYTLYHSCHLFFLLSFRTMHRSYYLFDQNPSSLYITTLYDSSLYVSS